MRILLVEDNEILATQLKKQLAKEGIFADLAFDGYDGLEKVTLVEYDVILLDINLPKITGFEILEKLRIDNNKTPIIMVTARDEVDQRIKGLDLGADDYLCKPFDITELIARIRAVVRRFHGRSQLNIKIGDLEIKQKSREVIINGKEINLQSKEFDILEYIASQYPAVISSEQIIEHVYDESFDPFSSVLRVHMGRLKKKLNEIDDEERLLTIRGKGYKLCEK